MVASYAKPNGNFTGVTCVSTELSPKRLEFAKQLVPGAKRVVYLHNPDVRWHGVARLAARGGRHGVDH
jgi:hypothetical protein